MPAMLFRGHGYLFSLFCNCKIQITRHHTHCHNVTNTAVGWDSTKCVYLHCWLICIFYFFIFYTTLPQGALGACTYFLYSFCLHNNPLRWVRLREGLAQSHLGNFIVEWGFASSGFKYNSWTSTPSSHWLYPPHVPLGNSCGAIVKSITLYNEACFYLSPL